VIQWGTTDYDLPMEFRRERLDDEPELDTKRSLTLHAPSMFIGAALGWAFLGIYMTLYGDAGWGSFTLASLVVALITFVALRDGDQA
jgi:hypothetical protein